jgi:DNA-binding transcriptional LysR family regulator
VSRSTHALTPEALAMVDAIARNGSFAGAARELGRVPSALTYSVRQLEEALDVLLFDRTSRHARLTPAGEELLNEGRRLLAEVEAVANRVKRVAGGWETQLTIAFDELMSSVTMLELCEAFFALRPDGRDGPGTRLRLRTEVLAGTWEALTAGYADLAIGVVNDAAPPPVGIELQPLGDITFVFAVAPHHPLAAHDAPIADAELLRHRAVAVADTAQRLVPRTVHLLPGQDVFTVPSTLAKIDAQVRGLACGFLPEPLVRDHVAAGRLVVREVQRPRQAATFHYAWRSGSASQPHRAPQGLALQWWLAQLSSATTRRALLDRHAMADVDGVA